MHPLDCSDDPAPFVIEPPPGSRLIGYGLMVLFGGGAIVYGIGMGFILDWPDDMSRWKLALIVGMPLVFAAVLGFMAWENARPFVLDRGRGALLDRGRPVLPLGRVRAVTVQREPGESCDFFAINLVLDGGPTFCLRRQWWPLDEEERTALARAVPIADYLDVELIGPSAVMTSRGRS